MNNEPWHHWATATKTANHLKQVETAIIKSTTMKFITLGENPRLVDTSASHCDELGRVYKVWTGFGWSSEAAARTATRTATGTARSATATLHCGQTT